MGVVVAGWESLVDIPSTLPELLQRWNVLHEVAEHVLHHRARSQHARDFSLQRSPRVHELGR